VLAVYFTSLNYPAILAFLKRQLPLAWQDKCRRAAQCFRTTILKWLRAEMLLILATFGVLLAGFLWMGLDYALLAAVFTALVDALPVLGTGTVLFPWALGCFLMGNMEQGLALLALYAVGLIVHTLLEPRLLAGQADLPPITVYEPTYVERPPEVDTSGEVQIEEFDGTWVVEAPWLQRLIANVNFGDYESRNWFDRMLRQCGLFDRLEEQGIRDGDTVSLYNLEFEYQR